MASTHAPVPDLDPTTRGLILLLPAAFLAHDVGEVAGTDDLNRALGELSGRVPALARRFAPNLAISRPQMAAAVATLTLGCGALSWQAVRSGARSPAMTRYAAATLVFGAHILGHVAQAVVLRRRLPGLGMGLLVSLPYSMVVLERLRRNGLVDPRAVRRVAAVGAVLGPPALLAVRAFGRTVAWAPGRPSGAAAPTRTAVAWRAW